MSERQEKNQVRMLCGSRVKILYQRSGGTMAEFNAAVRSRNIGTENWSFDLAMEDICDLHMSR